MYEGEREGVVKVTHEIKSPNYQKCGWLLMCCHVWSLSFVDAFALHTGGERVSGEGGHMCNHF